MPGSDVNSQDQAFWLEKTLDQMSTEEWESLCDGCARCCLLKLEDVDTGRLYFTSVHCRLLDLQQCRCTQYPRRSQQVPDCVTLTPENLAELSWMPSTCAYRLLAEGKPLPAWHPLVSGDPNSVHEAGISIRSYAIDETAIPADSVQEFIVDWLK